MTAIRSFAPRTPPSLPGAQRGYANTLTELRRQEQEGLLGPLRAFQSQQLDDDTATVSEAAKKAKAAEEEKDRDEQPEPGDEQQLSDGEEQMLRELEARDREVRAHEQAHKAAAGNLAVGGPSYTYQTGPDGKRYAIGGEVQIRLQTGGTPEESLRNAERAQRAANSPQSPSAPDRAVAAQAARMAQDAREQLREERSQDAPNAPGRVDTFA